MKHVFVLLLVCLFCAGCLEFKQTILLKDDDSMIVTLQYSVPTAHLPALTAFQRSITSWQTQRAHQEQDEQKAPMCWFFDELSVRRHFQHDDDGLTLLQYSKYEKGDKTCAEIIVVAKHAEQAFEKGYFGPVKLTQKTLTVQFPDTLRDTPPETVEQLRKLAANASFVLEVATPGTIVATNGKRPNEKTARWVFSTNRTPSTFDLFGTIADLVVQWN